MTDAARAAGKLPDAALLELSRAGDAAAFGILYERHHDAAQRLAVLLAPSAADADDLVAEAFARVLDIVSRGGGPAEAFRPYLLTVLRRVAYDSSRERAVVVPAEVDDLAEAVEEPADPAVAKLEASLAVRAFRSLSDRWQAVLWYAEIENTSAAELALLLGVSRNGLAALKRRAREGLRQAYLQMHIAAVTNEDCLPAIELLGAFIRGAVSRRDRAKVSEHLDRCDDCSAIYAELKDVNALLRGVIGPAIVGASASSYLHAATAGSVARWFTRLRARSRVRLHLVVGAGVVIVAAAAVALAATLTGNGTPAVSAHSGPSPVSAEPSTPQPAQTQHRPARTPSATPHTPAAVAPSAPLPRRSTTPDPPTATRLPGPSASPVPTPTASPAPSSSPSPAPAAVPTPGISVAAVGPGLDAVTFEVSDTGNLATGMLTALIVLPPGSSPLTLSATGGWLCAPALTGAVCLHASISAGETATGSFDIIAVGPACGQTVALLVPDGAGSADARSPEGIVC